MNILLIEDDGAVAHYLREAVEELGHCLFVAMNISRAKTYWRREQIDCIIADMNMDPTGLKVDERKRTQNGLLTGWVWLQNYVFQQKPFMKRQTIILTAYVSELEEKVDSEALKGCAIVSKNPAMFKSEEPTELAIFEHIKRIEERCNAKSGKGS